MTQLNWKRSIGQLVIANKGCRLLGFTAVRRGAGVTKISRHVAETMAAGGAKVLIITLPESHASLSRGSAGKAPAVTALRAAIVSSVHGYDLLAGPEAAALLAAYNTTQLHNALENDFGDYDRIVCDLPPLCDDASDGLSAATVATICDRVMLVCLIGVDHRAELSEAANLLRSVGASLSGVISNEFQRVDPIDVLRKSRLLHAVQ